MRTKMLLGLSLIVMVLLSAWTAAQQATTAHGTAPAETVVPNVINFSGVLTDLNGKALSGIHGVTFLLYGSEQGGTPLWMETQNITPGKNGYYTATLGVTTSQGLPTDLFASGEARWLAVQVAGQPEQSRVLLVAVPYALKAADAQTIGGLPPSAFMLAAPASGAAASATTAMTTASQGAPPPAGTVTGSGTADFIPLWTTTSNLGNSVLFQSGSGTTAKVGVNTTTPASTLDVKGSGIIRGTLSLPTTGPATATAGKNSQPLNLAASAFNSSNSTALNQTFQWQAEPASNDTATPSGTLNLLFGEGATKPSETGLNIASNGQITFATGQTFPTVTGNETVTGNISSDGSVSATTSFDIGGTPFAFGSSSKFNAFLGFAGNSTLTGGDNTAVGYNALFSDTTGGSNVASGADALFYNTTGSYNIAVGQAALLNNTTGHANTAIGNSAGSVIGGGSLVGSNNTALGTGATFGSGSLTNATALGANAEVTESNALVLGSISGVNGQTVSANVGIGITAPLYALDVRKGNSAFPDPNVGIYGAASGVSTEGVLVGGNTGVWGDTEGASGIFYGVLGTADNNSAGGFYNNATSSNNPTLWVENDGGGQTCEECGTALLTAYSGSTGKRCVIDAGASLSCDGTMTAVVAADNGARKVAVYSVQSPENWFEDFGSGALANGAATVALDPTFAQTVNTGIEYHVFLTPKGDSEGLYLSNETPQGFEVHEQRGGHSNIAFDYRIVAKRVGYETVRLADLTERFNKQEAQRQKMRRPARPTAAPQASPITPQPPLRAVAQPLAAQPK